MKEVKNPIIIENNNFSTLIIQLSYPVKFTKEEKIKYTLLTELLKNVNNEYREKSNFSKALIDNYIIDYNVFLHESNYNGFIKFSLTIPDDKSLPIKDITRSINFFLDSIFNPYFDKLNIDLLKNLYLNSIKDNKRNIDNIAYDKMINLVCPDILTFMNSSKYIKQINKKLLMKTYEKNILNNKPIVLIFGKNAANYLKTIKDYLGDNYVSKIKIYTNYANFCIPKNKINNIENTFNYNKSILYLAFTVKNFKEEDKNFLTILNSLLSSSESNILYKILRHKMGLVYSTHSFIYGNDGLIIIKAEIDKMSKDLALKGIKECYDLINDEKEANVLLASIKKGIDNEILTYFDNKFNIINDEFDSLTYRSKGNKDFLTSCSKITIKEIKKFNKRLVLDTIYFAKGIKK